MRTCIAVLAILSHTTPAQAEGCFGAGTELFHCTVEAGRKTADVCLQGDVAVYRFGPTGGEADLLLARGVDDVDMTPWPGVGRTIWEDMTFHNGDHSYTISRAMDRMIAKDDPDQSTDMRGTVVVKKRNETLSELECDPGSVSFGDFYPLFEAKEAAGQCWDREAFAWAKC